MVKKAKVPRYTPYAVGGRATVGLVGVPALLMVGEFWLTGQAALLVSLLYATFRYWQGSEVTKRVQHATHLAVAKGVGSEADQLRGMHAFLEVQENRRRLYQDVWLSDVSYEAGRLVLRAVLPSEWGMSDLKTAAALVASCTPLSSGKVHASRTVNGPPLLCMELPSPVGERLPVLRAFFKELGHLLREGSSLEIAARQWGDPLRLGLSESASPSPGSWVVQLSGGLALLLEFNGDQWSVQTSRAEQSGPLQHYKTWVDLHRVWGHFDGVPTTPPSMIE